MLRILILKNFNKITIFQQKKNFAAKGHRRPKPVLKPESKFESIFDKIFGKYLFLTNVITSGVLLASGDFILQTIETQTGILQEVDYTRIYRMLTVGSLMGPLHHWFYIYLDKFIPGLDFISIIKKVACDQTIMSPSCIVIFFYASGFLENKRKDECTIELREKFWTLYTADWLVWPVAQYINFHYVPQKYRVLYVYSLTMLCNIFVSFVKHDLN